MMKLHNVHVERYFKRGVKLCHHNKINLFIMKQKSKLEKPDSVQHVEIPPSLFQVDAGFFSQNSTAQQLLVSIVLQKERQSDKPFAFLLIITFTAGEGKKKDVRSCWPQSRKLTDIASRGC